MEQTLHTGTSTGNPTQKAITLLEAAKKTVGEIVESRKQKKLSVTRASHVAREINEIIKVLTLYLANENE